MAPEFSEQSLWFSENLLPHEAMLRGWLRSRFPAGLDVDDVIQESYLRILRHHKEKPIKAPKAFLFATARNIALNMERAANPSSTVKQILLLIINELETKSGKSLHYIFNDFLPQR